MLDYTYICEIYYEQGNNKNSINTQIIINETNKYDLEFLVCLYLSTYFIMFMEFKLLMDYIY